MDIRLVRHGESRANLPPGSDGHMAPQAEGDHLVPLTDTGWAQARVRGAAIGAEFLNDALVYRSPYTRTRQTLDGILDGAGLAAESVRVFEDPRLRELEHGFEGDWETVEEQAALRRTHGWFFYRFRTGESPADCFDRVSSFLESLMRQAERKQASRALIVTHGITIRCFVMRFLHLTYEEYEQLRNPGNCDQIRIAPLTDLSEPTHRSGRWGVEGLGLRER